MSEKSDKKTNGFWSGKGYYIALILCAVAVGITGYVYYANAGEETLQDTPVAVTDGVQTASTGATETAGSEAEETENTEAATQATVGRLSACAPVEGTTLAEYAMECLSYNETTRDWRVHNGLDIGAEAGTEVCAAAAGQVYTVYDDEEMGTTVVIRHDGGYTTKYSSLSQDVTVSAGDTVEMGQTVGTVGSTALMETALGDHVHFSVTKDDTQIDPTEFLNME